MVSVAQLVEHQVVALRVVGSSPTTHPIFLGLSMNFLDGNFLAGVLLLLLGITVLLKAIFNLDIPIFKIVLGSILVYCGLIMLFETKFGFVQKIKQKKINFKIDFNDTCDDKE